MNKRPTTNFLSKFDGKYPDYLKDMIITNLSGGENYINNLSGGK